MIVIVIDCILDTRYSYSYSYYVIWHFVFYILHLSLLDDSAMNPFLHTNDIVCWEMWQTAL